MFIRFIEIQRGKEEMKSQKINAQVGVNVGCTLRLLPEYYSTPNGGCEA